MKKWITVLLTLCLITSILISPTTAETADSPMKDFSLEDLFMFRQLIDLEITLRLSKGEKSSWFDSGLGAELPTPMSDKWKNLTVMGKPMNTDSQFYAVVKMEETWDMDIYFWKLEHFFDFKLAVNNSALPTNSATKENITVTVTKDEETMTMTVIANRK